MRDSFGKWAIISARLTLTISNKTTCLCDQCQDIEAVWFDAGKGESWRATSDSFRRPSKQTRSSSNNHAQFPCYSTLAGDNLHSPLRFPHTCHSSSNNPVVGVARSARYSSCRMAHCSSLRRTSRRMSTSRSPRLRHLRRYAKISPCLLFVVLTDGVDRQTFKALSTSSSC